MEATFPYEKPIDVQHTARRYIPEDEPLQNFAYVYILPHAVCKSRVAPFQMKSIFHETARYMDPSILSSSVFSKDLISFCSLRVRSH
jgi:hypothetical protein